MLNSAASVPSLLLTLDRRCVKRHTESQVWLFGIEDPIVYEKGVIDIPFSTKLNLQEVFEAGAPSPVPQLRRTVNWAKANHLRISCRCVTSH